MGTLIITAILLLWIALVLPAVILPFLPRNPTSSAAQAPRTASRLTFLSPKSAEKTSSGQAVA